MMDTETAAKPSQTYDLGPVEQIPIGEGRLLRIGHLPVAVFRARDGSVFATQGPSARIEAARWPTGSLAGPSSSARCTATNLSWTPVSPWAATATR